MEVRDEHEVNDLVHWLVSELLGQFGQIWKLFSILMAHVKPAIEDNPFIRDLDKNAAPSDILAGS